MARQMKSKKGTNKGKPRHLTRARFRADFEKHSAADEDRPPRKIANKVYEAELARLHIELVRLQEWIRTKGLKVVIIFEGRDAAGKAKTA